MPARLSQASGAPPVVQPVQSTLETLMAVLHTQAYAATSRARTRGPDTLSAEAVAVYRTMVSAYAQWAHSAGIDVFAEPQRAINGFLAERCTGPRPWSAATHRRYARLLTRLHWAHGGGALVVIEGQTERPAAAAVRNDVDHEWMGGATAWISRGEVDRLIAPLIAQLPADLLQVLSRLPVTGPAIEVPQTPAASWKLARDLVMLSMGLDIGVRFQEIRLLRQGSVEIDRVRAQLVVHRDETARTAKHRTIASPRNDGRPRQLGLWRAQILLKWWLATMPAALRGADNVLFPSTAKGGPLTASTAYRILERLGEASPDPVHWLFTGGIQSLRRAHIQMALSEGVSPHLLQAQLGLHRLESVQRYLEDSEAALGMVVQSIEERAHSVHEGGARTANS